MNVLEIKGLALSLSQMTKPTLEELNKLLKETGHIVIPAQVKDKEAFLERTNGGRALLKAQELWNEDNFTARIILRGLGLNIPMIGQPVAHFYRSTYNGEPSIYVVIAKTTHDEQIF